MTMKQKKKNHIFTTERFMFALFTLVSGSISAALVYLFQPGVLSGIWVVIVLFLLVIFIPLTLLLFVSLLSRSPAAVFKTIGKWLAGLFGYFIIPG
jgi:hypothetical protein